MHSPVPLHFFAQAHLGEVWRLERRRSGCYSYQHCLPPDEEEETTGLQSKAILHKLLPLKVSQGLHGTLGSRFSSVLPSGSSTVPGRRNHHPLPIGKEDLAAKLGMGRIFKKILPVPSWTGHLIRRPLLSSWRTYLPCWRRTQGIVHRYLEPFGTLYLPRAGRYDLALWAHLRWH